MTRYKGDGSSERLSQSEINDTDAVQTRHRPGNSLSDSDRGVSKAIFQTMPVAVCTSAASTAAKVATVQNFPDFFLNGSSESLSESYSGREVICYMENGNSATGTVTLNVNNTGAITLEATSWQAGTFLKLHYINITVNGSTIEKWIADTGYTNVTSQLNGALTNYNNSHIITYKFENATIDTQENGNDIGVLPEDMWTARGYVINFNDYNAVCIGGVNLATKHVWVKTLRDTYMVQDVYVTAIM